MRKTFLVIVVLIGKLAFAEPLSTGFADNINPSDEPEMQLQCDVQKPWLQAHPELRQQFLELTNAQFESLLQRGLTDGECQRLVGRIIVAPLPANVPHTTSYPNYCFVLPVPWIKQWPPCNDGKGIARNNTNCGQACGVMLGGYFNHGAVESWVITAENEWMKKNVCGSGGTGTTQLMDMLWGCHRVHAINYRGNNVDDIINEVAHGRPTIVGCMISAGTLRKYGVDHWALAVGYNSNIILNDPGSSIGQYRAYSLSDFADSWGAGYNSRIYIPTWK